MAKNNKEICCICGENIAAYFNGQFCNFGACSDPKCLLERLKQIRNGKNEAKNEAARHIGD